jgi:hypothetical protein
MELLQKSHIAGLGGQEAQNLRAPGGDIGDENFKSFPSAILEGHAELKERKELPDEAAVP